MKKYAALILCLACLMAVSCNTSARVKNDAIPSEYATLEFWNGGTCIATYEQVFMSARMTASKTLLNEVSFYLYHIYSEAQGIDDYIIDSEALALKYTLPQKTFK